MVMVILSIILEILKAFNSMPPEQKLAHWERHQANLDFWVKIFDRFQVEEKGPA